MSLSLLTCLLNGTFLMLRLDGIGSFPRPLSAEEEQKYLRAYLSGDTEARNILVERNLRLVAHIVKKYYAVSCEQDDLISIGTIGLIKGISSYQPDKGVRLATYASRCVENAILSQARYTQDKRILLPLKAHGIGFLLCHRIVGCSAVLPAILSNMLHYASFAAA